MSQVINKIIIHTFYSTEKIFVIIYYTREEIYVIFITFFLYIPLILPGFFKLCLWFLIAQYRPFSVLVFAWYSWEIKILGWCPTGPILPHGEKVPLLILVGHPSSDGVPIKKLYGLDVLQQPASHPIFSYWVG